MMRVAGIINFATIFNNYNSYLDIYKNLAKQQPDQKK